MIIPRVDQSDQKETASSYANKQAILLQIVMVTPGTHPVKNHESLFITNESMFKKSKKS